MVPMITGIRNRELVWKAGASSHPTMARANLGTSWLDIHIRSVCSTIGNNRQNCPLLLEVVWRQGHRIA